MITANSSPISRMANRRFPSSHGFGRPARTRQRKPLNTPQLDTLPKKPKPKTILSLPTELRHIILTYALENLYDISEFKTFALDPQNKYKGYDLGPRHYWHPFWYFLWQASEVLKLAFPELRDEVEYLRMTWAGKPDEQFVGRSLITLHWGDEEFMRGNERKVIVEELWMISEWL